MATFAASVPFANSSNSELFASPKVSAALAGSLNLFAINWLSPKLNILSIATLSRGLPCCRVTAKVMPVGKSSGPISVSNVITHLLHNKSPITIIGFIGFPTTRCHSPTGRSDRADLKDNISGIAGANILADAAWTALLAKFFAFSTISPDVASRIPANTIF